MKKRFLTFTTVLFIFLSGIFLVSCDSTQGDGSHPDYNADIRAALPESITAEHFTVEPDTTYYTSPGLSLWMEVNGHYLEMDYFSLDGTKRVYDNMFFYKDDYFYMVTDDVKELYASLVDGYNSEYVEEEKQSGESVQINIKKSGKYKLIFDVETLKFDVEYKAEIETPVYYTIKNCSIYSVATDWIEMSVDPNNREEFVIKDYNVEAGKIISFFSNIHTSNYKVTLEESIDNKLASVRKTDVTVNVGGKYNVYINSKTYEVRLELISPDTASYSCVYYDGTDFIELQPCDTNVPYIFRQRIAVTTKYTTSLPEFHTAKYQTYDLTVVDPESVLMGSGSNYYFKQPGTYEVTVNLKTFEISAELIPE